MIEGGRGRRATLTMSDVERIVAETTFPTRVAEPRIGIEIEAFPIATSNGITRRTSLKESATLLADEGFTLREGLNPSFDLPDAGTLTFEPGGQLEHSSAPAPIVCDAINELLDVRDFIVSAYSKHGISLAFTGVDHWHDVEDVPQQLAGPRYPAMASYFDDRGPWGAVMMRHTSSLQINLETGSGDVARERWQLANLAVPLLTATFSTSPSHNVHSTRALAWQQLDPTRTGFPGGFVAMKPDPAGHMTEFALDADVLVVIRDGTAVQGSQGWSFRDWLTEPHPELGFPRAADLDYHLTTLFPEVRPRAGVLEIRSCDALPPRWQPVPVVLMAGLLYDDVARQEALEVLERYLHITPLLWSAAAARGLADDTIAYLVEHVWPLALEGSKRLGKVFIGPKQAISERFVEAYPMQRKTPADELRELLDHDAMAALEWAAG